MPSRTSERRPSRAAEAAEQKPLSLVLLERALEAGAFMLRLTETLTPFAVVADVNGAPGLVSIDAESTDPDELEVRLVEGLQTDAAEGILTGAAWAYTIDVRTPDYAGPALKVYVDVKGEQPFVAYTPYTFSMGEPAELGDTHRLDAEASVLFPLSATQEAAKSKSSAAKSSAAKSSAAKSSAAKSSATNSSAAKSSAAKSSATNSSATNSSATKADATNSSATKSSATKSSATKADATNSNATKSSVKKAGTAKSDANVKKAGAAKSSTTKSGAKKASRTAPKRR